MTRSTAFLLPIALCLVLAGCASPADPTSTATSTPADSVAPTGPAPTATPTGDITCENLLDSATVGAALGDVVAHEGTEGTWGYGTGVLALTDILKNDPAVLNCVWLSATDPKEGAIVSVSTDQATVDAAHAYLAPMNYEEATGPSGEQIFLLRGMHPDNQFTEAHAFLDGLWVAVFNSFDSEAQLLSETAVASIVANDPGRF